MEIPRIIMVTFMFALLSFSAFWGFWENVENFRFNIIIFGHNSRTTRHHGNSDQIFGFLDYFYIRLVYFCEKRFSSNSSVKQINLKNMTLPVSPILKIIPMEPMNLYYYKCTKIHVCKRYFKKLKIIYWINSYI